MKAVLYSPDKYQWLKAIDEVYEQHQFEHTWDPRDKLPPEAPFIPSHIVLVNKRFADGTINKYKARLVAGGHKQDSPRYSITSSHIHMYHLQVATIHNDTSEPKEPFESETELIQNSNQHSMTLRSRIRVIILDSMSGSDSNDSDDM